ncbi:MAG TPA: helix-turn-helix transcriptional regulator [Jiangellaceae bacterium]
MAPVRWVHLVNVVLWSASAAIGWWWARGTRTRRARHRIYAVVTLALVIALENLLQALATHHPRSGAHLAANIVLAVAGIVAFFVAAMFGRDVVTDERVLFALSRGRLGASRVHPVAEAQHEAESVRLTPRETEVIRCLCEGLSTEEIAARLSISPHTTTTHVRNILRKLDVSSRADAIVWAVEHGLPPSRK